MLSKGKKLEIQRIEAENKFLAKKLENNSSALVSVNELEKEYIKSKRIKENISKSKLKERLKKCIKPIINEKA